MNHPLTRYFRTLVVASAVLLGACGGGGGGDQAPAAAPGAGTGGSAVVDTGSSSGTGGYTGPGTTAGSTGTGDGGGGTTTGGSGGSGAAGGSGAGAGAGAGAGSGGTAGSSGDAGAGSGSSSAGGSGTGTGSGAGGGTGTGTADGSGSGVGTGSGTADGSGTSAGGGSGGSGSAGGTAGGDGSGTASGSGADGSGTSGDGGTGVAGGSGAGSGGTGVGDGSGTGVAGGVGSGGTGVGDGSGTGSGGTGAAASAVGIGSVDGFGSIIVNDTHWDIDNANVIIVDGTELKIGMSVRVAGTISADLSRGTATSVVSAAELRGRPSAPDAAAGSFELMGIQVLTDENTVFEGLSGVGGINNGTVVQVYGLPSTIGQLLATRVERRTGSVAPIVTGAISALDTATRTFKLGTLTVSYANAGFGAGLTQASLANGQIVRVRANQDAVGGVLAAASVQSWYEVGASANGTRLSLSGLVTDFVSPSDFRVQGVRVSGAQTNVSGGPARLLANGVRVEVSGKMDNGVLVLDKLRLRSRVAEVAPTIHSVTGNIAQFTSLANFKVQGQTIDASSAALVVSNGTTAQVSRGRRVTVTGRQLVGEVLIADSLTFLD